MLLLVRLLRERQNVEQRDSLEPLAALKRIFVDELR